MKKTLMCIVGALALAATAAESSKSFDINQYRDVMGTKYWELWGPAEQARIDQDIEANRKADANFALGIPAGTEVKVEQIRHGFFFGAMIFDFNQLASDDYNTKYKAMWKELFNSATIPFYWKDYEPTPGVFRDDETPDNNPDFWQGKTWLGKKPLAEPWKERFYRKPPVRKVIEFCNENHVRKHGHPLVWGCNMCLPQWYFDAIPQEITQSEQFKREFIYTRPLRWCNYWCIMGDLSEEEFAKKYPEYCDFVNNAWHNRVIQICNKYGDQIDSWDVVNESAKDTTPKTYLGTAPRLVPGG